MRSPLDPTEARQGRAPVLTIRVSRRDRQRLKSLASADGKGQSELAREALSQYLDQREHQEASTG